MSVITMAIVAAMNKVIAPVYSNDQPRSSVNERIDTPNQVNARGDHGRGMIIEGTDWSRRFHCIRQPNVQRELSRLAKAPDPRKSQAPATTNSQCGTGLSGEPLGKSSNNSSKLSVPK